MPRWVRACLYLANRANAFENKRRGERIVRKNKGGRWAEQGGVTARPDDPGFRFEVSGLPGDESTNRADGTPEDAGFERRFGRSAPGRRGKPV